MQKERILVWGLSNNRAGTEMVIYNYVKSMPEMSFDFLCYEEPASFSDLFDAGQHRWFVIPMKLRHPVAHGKALRAFMREHWHEYCALWMNVGDVSNIDLLKQASRQGIPKRILHMHSSSMPHKFITRVFSALNRNAVRNLVTDRWACSESAGRFLYGEDPYEVIPNRINAATCRFSKSAREEVRAEWDLKKAFVIGVVGRLAPEKNQGFLIEVLPQMLEERPEVKLLVIGAGPLENELRHQAEEAGVASAVIWAGYQKNVGRLLSAMDAFAMPSVFEGLPLSLLEAQFNGLPCVVSEGVTSEGFIAEGVTSASIDDKALWMRLLLGASREAVALDEVRAALFDTAYAPGKVRDLLVNPIVEAGRIEERRS